MPKGYSTDPVWGQSDRPQQGVRRPTTYCDRICVATVDGQVRKQAQHNQAVGLLCTTTTGHRNSGGMRTPRDASCHGQVLVKLDFTNAFNILRRDAMLEAVYSAIPEIYPFALQSYPTPSTLKFGHLSLSSQVGPQQGDPLGPLLFSLPLQPVLQSLESL